MTTSELMRREARPGPELDKALVQTIRKARQIAIKGGNDPAGALYPLIVQMSSMLRVAQMNEESRAYIARISRVLSSLDNAQDAVYQAVMDAQKELNKLYSQTAG